MMKKYRDRSWKHRKPKDIDLSLAYRSVFDEQSHIFSIGYQSSKIERVRQHNSTQGLSLK